MGVTPLADRLRTAAQLAEEEPTAPLDLALCGGCSLVQIQQTVAPEILFGQDYPYFSSVSQTVLHNAHCNVESLIRRYDLDASSSVLEIAANDGYLLTHFVARGIPALGVDPAPGPAAQARGRGVEMIEDFFSAKLAVSLADAGCRFDVVIANNVLAHVAGLHDFLDGVRTVLDTDGAAVFEIPYVLDLIDRLEFDTIYHQHLCYFSLTALEAVLAAHGLMLHDVEQLPIHGGSLRVHARVAGERSTAVEAMLAAEKSRQVHDTDCYSPLREGVANVRRELCALLGSLKSQGKRIAAFGAAAKGATLLSVCGIGAETLEFVADSNAHKHGLYMGGSPLLIRPAEALIEDRPDYVLLLAWNHAPEILAQQAAYLEAGGKFIVPVPHPVVIDAS